MAVDERREGTQRTPTWPTRETPEPSAFTDAPLTGLRVVDFTHLVAGPFCTMLLAGAGASVVKIEPPWGDSSRLRGARREDAHGRHVSGYVVAGNRGKKSVVLDIKNEQGRDLTLALVREVAFAPVAYAQGVDPGRVHSGVLAGDEGRALFPQQVQQLALQHTLEDGVAFGGELVLLRLIGHVRHPCSSVPPS